MPAVYAEYCSPERLVAAIEAVRARGVRRIATYGPLAVSDAAAALGLPPSRLPVLVGIGGVVGAVCTYTIQWLLASQLYPLDVGGRPAHMPLAFFVLSFEIGVLCAALSGFGGLIYVAGLGRLYRPAFEVPGIASASADKYWLEITTNNTAIARARTALETTNPLRIVVRHDEEPR